MKKLFQIWVAFYTLMLAASYASASEEVEEYCESMYRADFEDESSVFYVQLCIDEQLAMLYDTHENGQADCNPSVTGSMLESDREIDNIPNNICVEQKSSEVNL